MGKILVDEIEKTAEGTGIQLNSPLLSNSGNELLSAAGALSGNVDLSGADLSNTTFPAGHVLRIYQVYKTNIFTTTSSSYVDVPGLSLTISPLSNLNKIFCIFTLSGGIAGATGAVQLHRNGSAIGLPDIVAGKTNRMLANFYAPYDSNQLITRGNSFLDSPSTTSSLTYNIKISCPQSAGTFVVNDSASQASYTTYSNMGTSQLTLMEIQG